MTRIYPGLHPSQVRMRAEALERFGAWARQRHRPLSPADALSGVALLFDLLPESSRARPVDAEGVRRLHRCLAVLGRPRP